MNVGWDDAKDLVNQQKHGLSFAKARILFDSDADYLVIFDADHSESEDRFMAIGAIERGIVVIAFTEPKKIRFESSAPAGPARGSSRCTAPTWIATYDRHPRTDRRATPQCHPR